MRILGISGSLRRGSHNLTLLRAAAAQLPSDAELEEYRDLALIPAYSEDLDAAAAPQAVHRLRRAIGTAADAVIIATPEYNGSVPGGLKNALDWASRPGLTTACAASPWSLSAQAPARLAPSGLRRSCARS